MPGKIVRSFAPCENSFSKARLPRRRISQILLSRFTSGIKPTCDNLSNAPDFNKRASSSVGSRIAAGRIARFTPVPYGTGLVSVALTLSCDRPVYTGHPALCCLDFPPRSCKLNVVIALLPRLVYFTI